MVRGGCATVRLELLDRVRVVYAALVLTAFVRKWEVVRLILYNVYVESRP